MAGKLDDSYAKFSNTVNFFLVSYRMEGKCEYVLPTGTKYVGDMKDGM